MPTSQPSILATENDRRIAYHHTEGRSPGVIFLGGFMSDMTGSKALALESWCQGEGLAFTRFDYRGHGASSDKFEHGTIGDWLDDAVTVVDKITTGPQVLVGSSMGGWISLLLALERPERVAGIVTIACATDFVTRLLCPALTEEQLSELETAGVTEIPTEYQEEPYRIGKALIDTASHHQLLNGPIDIHCPVTMIHGSADVDVPLETSELTLRLLASKHQSRLLVVEDGDHRLSQPEQLNIITSALHDLIKCISR